MITYLGMKFPTKFAKATSEIGMPIHWNCFWLNEHLLCGVMQTSISVNQHFAAFYGHRFTVPKCEIWKLGLSFVEPKTATVEHENSKITFS
jgi:hypothetical protein